MILEIDDLHLHFEQRGLDNSLAVAKALNGVTLKLSAGEILGLVGETGAGKSLTAQAALGLVRSPGRIVAGTVRFDGREITRLGDRAMTRLRGTRMTAVAQQPLTALDPLKRVGPQLVRMQRRHRRISQREAEANALAMLREVRIPDPERRMAAWPHELSGGMAQRVIIAMALINGPDLLVADEPTTGLDVTVQAEILDLLADLVRKRRTAVLLITHDLGVVAHYCDRVAVMFAGAVVEEGAVHGVFARPRHPYAQALIAASRARKTAPSENDALPPDLFALPRGCAYRPRCPHAEARCKERPGLRDLGDRRVACHVAGSRS
jgi:peptide/nickel transport system ATP-binding protein/oligopeptide transport system ATP-binding protein